MPLTLFSCNLSDMELYPTSWTRFFLNLVGIYIAVVVIVYFMQSKLLYAPGKDGRDHARYNGWQCWPDEEDFHGYISKHPPKKPLGTALVWHGNAGTALDRGYFIYALEKRNWRVILMEYPGYGDREGSPGEEVFYADARKAVDKAMAEFGEPMIFFGESLGNGVASKMAEEYRDRIIGLVMITPWATLPDLAQSLYPFLPAKWLAKDKFDNITNAGAFPGPVAVIMSGQDDVIPNGHTQRLYDSLPEPKKMWFFPKHGHNNWPCDPGEDWWDEVLVFMGDETQDI